MVRGAVGGGEQQGRQIGTHGNGGLINRSCESDRGATCCRSSLGVVDEVLHSGATQVIFGVAHVECSHKPARDDIASA